MLSGPKLRLGTLVVIAAMLGICATLAILSYEPHAFSLIPSRVVHGQIWRLFTSAFFYTSFIHFLADAMSFGQIGATLERTMGTLLFLFHVGVFIILNSLAFVAASFLLSCVGLSGAYNGRWTTFTSTILSLIIIERNFCAPVRADGKSLCGLILVPDDIYPIILAGVMCLMSEYSVVGGAIGILMGFMYPYIVVFIPRRSTFRKIEHKLGLSRCLAYVSANGIDRKRVRPFALFEYLQAPVGESSRASAVTSPSGTR